MSEFRRALRSLLRNPEFTLVAVLTLALGTGANTAVFSVVQNVLLRPLPYPDADRLLRVRLQPRSATEGAGESSYATYLTLRREAAATGELAGFATSSGHVVVDLGRGPELMSGQLVTGNLPTVLGMRPVLGRVWGDADDLPGAAPTVLVSEALWRSRLGADPQVLGQTIKVDGTPVEIVGVLPAGTAFPAGADVFTPVGAILPEPLLQSSASFLNLVARLQPGANGAAFEGMLDGLLEREINSQLPPNARLHATHTSFAEALFGDTRSALLLLLGSAFLVLLVACANVANLQMVRGVGRAGDFAVRRALGAGPVELGRHALAETVVLGAAGGGLGLLAAIWGVAWLQARNPAVLFRADTIGVDPGALLISLGAALVTVAAFALLPVAQALRLRLPEVLHGGGRTTLGPRGRRLLDGFVVAQVALALVLCVAASLLLRSFEKLRSVDAGFEAGRVVTMAVPLLDARYQDPDAHDRFFTRLVTEVEAQPGVERAGGVLLRPLDSPEGYDATFTIEGQSEDEQHRNPILNLEAVTPGYFAAMGIPLASGRDVAPTDEAQAAPVAVVSRELAALLSASRPGNPSLLGTRFKWGGVQSEAPWVEVIGVAGDVRSRAMESGRLDAYVPYRQSPWPLQHLVVRTRGSDVAAALASVREVMRRLDPGVEPIDVYTTSALVDRAVARPRFQATLVGLFAGLALVIGAVGLFGVLAYSLAVRSREMGVRLALGATPGAILRLAVKRGLGLAGIGVGVGGLASLVTSRLLAGQLYGVAPLDPIAFAVSGGVLLAVALLASAGPAWRASRVEPTVVLRAE